MFKQLIKSFVVLSLSVAMMNPVNTENQTVDTSQVTVVEEPEVTAVVYEQPVVMASSIDIPVMAEEDINLIALVTMAEAEGESEYGKRLVIDTILNRVDHEDPYWPDTVSGVIYQKNAFTSMWNGRVNRCYVDEDIVRLVREELLKRTNTKVVYFMRGDYSQYGTPGFSEGNHYFSSY